jgi:hypothetical protein
VRHFQRRNSYTPLWLKYKEKRQLGRSNYRWIILIYLLEEIRILRRRGLNPCGFRQEYLLTLMGFPVEHKGEKFLSEEVSLTHFIIYS